jgi:hypothetical protein
MAAKKPPAKRQVFTRDEMSTGKGSKLVRRAATALSSQSTASFPKLRVETPAPRVPHRERAETALFSQKTAAFPKLKVETPAPRVPQAARTEIRLRERTSTTASAGSASAKQKTMPADLFAKQKMKEAQDNLPDWGTDDEVEVAQELDPDETDLGLDEP